jgi:hypothetical protein
VRLVDNNELGRGAEELVAAAIALDEIRRNDRDRVTVKERLVEAEASLQASSSGRQDEFRIEVELVSHLGLPLPGQVRWAQHGQALHVAPIEEFACDQERFDRLANADVVCD